MRPRKYKICAGKGGCGKKKLYDKFYKLESGKDGYRAVCKKCYDRLYAKKYRTKTRSPLLGENVYLLCKKNRTAKINYFGFFVGIIVTISKGQYMAYSTLEKTQTFRTIAEATLFLYHQVIEAGFKIQRALNKQNKLFLEKFSWGVDFFPWI